VKAGIRRKTTKKGEGCEGEIFTLIVQFINELRAKGEWKNRGLRVKYTPEIGF